MLAAASLVGVLAGCSVQLGRPSTPVSTSPNTPVTPPSASTDSVRIVLRFGDETAAATLADTPAAREFAAMLPLELDLRDPMGQAKSGPLPRPLDVSGTDPVFDPAVGPDLLLGRPAARSPIFYDRPRPVRP